MQLSIDNLTNRGRNMCHAGINNDSNVDNTGVTDSTLAGVTNSNTIQLMQE